MSVPRIKVLLIRLAGGFRRYETDLWNCFHGFLRATRDSGSKGKGVGGGLCCFFCFLSVCPFWSGAGERTYRSVRPFPVLSQRYWMYFVCCLPFVRSFRGRVDPCCDHVGCVLSLFRFHPSILSSYPPSRTSLTSFHTERNRPHPINPHARAPHPSHTNCTLTSEGRREEIRRIDRGA